MESLAWGWAITLAYRALDNMPGMVLSVLGALIVLVAVWRHYADSAFRITRATGLLVTLFGIGMASVGMWLVIRGELAPPPVVPWWQFWR